MSSTNINIGRSPDNNHVINDPGVSSQHAVIQIDSNGNCWIMDKGSKNGTFVNGVRIFQKTFLSPSDEVRMGNTRLRLNDILGSHGNRPFASSPSLEPINEPSPVQYPSLRKSNPVPWVIALTLILTGTLVGYMYINRDESGNTTDNDDKTRKTIKTSPQMKGKSSKPDISYSLSCMEEGSITDQAINMGSDLEDMTLDNSGIDVSLQEEVDAGAEIEKDLRENHEFISSGAEYDNLVDIKNKLVKQIDDPRGFEYNIFLIEDDQINAITAGANIFVTTAMVDFCKNDDELACVIGHEIEHNELGHITVQLKKRKLSENVMGKDDSWVLENTIAFLGMPFNQTNEIESDLHGVDLAIAAGYDGCAASNLWTRMGENESSNELSKWFRTHPYSATRKDCIKDHIQDNYDYNCK